MRSMGLIRGAVCVLLGPLAMACSSGREVEVTGEVAAPSSVTLSGPIRVEFIDIVDAEDQAQNEVVHELDTQLRCAVNPCPGVKTQCLDNACVVR